VKKAEIAVEILIESIGEDPGREGLKETPTRVTNSYDHILGGYKKDPKDLLTTFTECDGYDEIVLLKDIEIYSMCEHHMLPFFGKAHIGYLPGGCVIGVSKLARLLEIYSRRLQIQERIGQQVTDFLMDELKAEGAGCIIEATHLCMRMRGVEKQNSIMVTSSVRGAFKDNLSTRQEWMGLIK
jgi:GTP cyclohydrolase I